MRKLPRDLSGRQVIAALARAGFESLRWHGSHCILQSGDTVVTVPDHKVVRVGTLRQIIRDSGLTVAEFIRLL